MNKHSLYIFLIICLQFAGFSEAKNIFSAAEDIKISAEEVILRYIDSTGGGILVNIESATRKGTLTRGDLGAVPFEAFSRSGGKWYYKQIFAYGDVVNYVCDGKKAWFRDTKKTGSVSNEEKLDLQILTDYQMPIKLKCIFPQMNIKPDTSNENIIINAVTAGGIERELEFDKNTGLLFRAGDIYFASYKEIDGVKLPEIIYIGENNGVSLRLRMEIKETVFNKKIDDSVFTFINFPLSYEKSQLYTLRKQIYLDEKQLNKYTGIYQDPDQANVSYTISTQKNHLMFQVTGKPPKMEIKPESEIDFFVRFLNLEFHFIKDAAGNIAALQIGADKNKSALKIY